MPKVFEENGYWVGFYSYDLQEPVHVHVRKDGAECKVWINPLSIAFSRRFSAQELNHIVKMVEEHRTEILNAWKNHERHQL